jgi:murein DD-endopeptidase MepM/ murein hydrolase activator NlpD
MNGVIMRLRLTVFLFALAALGGCTAVDEATEDHAVRAPGQNGFQVMPYPGETIESLAQRYDVSKDVLVKANHLKFPYILQPHQILIVPPPATYRVRAGDTVEGIATTLGVDETPLAQANGLQKPYHMRIGQILKVPGGVGGDIAPAQPVEPGFTGVAPVPRSAISKQALPPPPGESNAIGAAPVAPPPQPAPMPPAPQQQSFAPPPVRSSPTALAPQSSAQPSSSRNNSQLAAAGAAVATASSAPTSIVPAAPAPAAVAAQPESLAPPTAVEGAVAGAPHFVKPVSGQVIQGFGPDGSGQTNDGVNIAAAAGTPVKAADAGTVIYTGNELAAFGNLILVRHAGGWVTAYGHLANIGVQRGQTVVQGQALGTVGQTGSATTPQLHFEIRQGSKPVDPSPYLNAAKG